MSKLVSSSSSSSALRARRLHSGDTDEDDLRMWDVRLRGLARGLVHEHDRRAEQRTAHQTA
jgi:hypothetical protein